MRSILSSRARRDIYVLCATGLLLFLCPFGRAAAAERYYLMVFGAQSIPRIPRKSHTFAELVKFTLPSPGCKGATVLQTYPISWLPATLKVRAFKLHPEPGVNLTLHQTLRWCRDNRLCVYYWGPYEVDPRFAQRFMQQSQYLSCGGRELYKAIDPLFSDNISNCTHAISDLDPVMGRPRYPFVVFGKDAARNVANILHRRDVVLDPGRDNRWLLYPLGLANEPMKRMRVSWWGKLFRFGHGSYQAR